MNANDAAFAAADKWIDEHYQQLRDALARLIACPSTEQAAADNAPFGPGVRQALDTALAIAAESGLEVLGDDDGYLGTALLRGETDAAVGVLGHVDVVPVTEAEWRFPPFALTEEDGRLYGRGTLDDKGPLLAAVFAGAALRETGCRLKKSVLYMFGGNEESGCHCLEHYLAGHTPPECGFSPDAEFPLVIGEKGICHFRLSRPLPGTEKGMSVLSAHGGTVPNVVPGTAEALLRTDGSEPPAPTENVTLRQEGDMLRITATGQAAHGSMPEEGVNAVCLLLRYLAALPLAGEQAEVFRRLAQLTADECHGKSLGLDARDEVSVLTLAPTVFHIEDGTLSLTCDMRFPVSCRKEEWLARIEALAEKEGCQAEILNVADPLYAREDDPLARKLLAAYRDHTGDDSPPLVIGGGTYAKEIPNFLAFGPEFAHTPKLCHQADEYVSKKDLLDAAKIYARAILLLAG